MEKNNRFGREIPVLGLWYISNRGVYELGVQHRSANQKRLFAVCTCDFYTLGETAQALALLQQRWKCTSMLF